MADAGNTDLPMLLQADHFDNLLAQLTDIVTHALFTERTEAGQILSDLFRRNAEPFTEFFRGNDIDAGIL